MIFGAIVGSDYVSYHTSPPGIVREPHESVRVRGEWW